MIKNVSLLTLSLFFFTIFLESKPEKISPRTLSCGSPEHVQHVAEIIASIKPQAVNKKKRLLGGTLHIVADGLIQGFNGDQVVTKLGKLAERELGCTNGRAWVAYIVKKFFFPGSQKMLKEMVRSVFYDYYLSLAKFSLDGVDESKLEKWFDETFALFMKGNYKKLSKLYDKPFRAFFIKLGQEHFGLSEEEARLWTDDLLKKHAEASPRKKAKFEDLKREQEKLPIIMGLKVMQAVTMEKGKAQRASGTLKKAGRVSDKAEKKQKDAKKQAHNKAAKKSKNTAKKHKVRTARS